MAIEFHPYESQFVAQIRAGGPDAYGNPAERAVSDGAGVPCRSCLCNVPAGHDYLILAARPFDSLQPYAETGPIFLCAEACTPWAGASAGDQVPPILTTSPDYLLKGYSGNQRIIYGTGRVVRADQLAAYAEQLFDNPDLAYVDVRSARNNCFQTRITRTA
jgi:Protein of unknown function (DUF1203)